MKKRILKNKKLLATGGVLVFILVLYLPLVFQLFKISGGPQLVEKRKLARKPEFRLDSIFSYFKQYTPYYNDHFTFRPGLVYLNNLFKVKILGVSPTPRVLIGKNGWLFLDRQEPRPSTVDYYRSMTLFTRQELEQWKNLLEQRHQWLKARGIHYLFLIVPNKNTIYPEFMPHRIRRVRKISRMDQLVGFLRSHSTVPVLDIRPTLIAAKARLPVYSRTDSHWNDYGAYMAYRGIITYISRHFSAFKGIDPIPLSRFKIETVNHSGGDLAIMLALNENVLREDMIELKAVPPLKIRGNELPDIARFVKQSRTEMPTADIPNILMVHDSFYKRIKPFLSGQFSRVLYIWDWGLNFYPQIIEKEKPKLVIDEIAERFLLHKIPVNPSMLAVVEHLDTVFHERQH
jgi:alginate O-acetyltransferase complex protein AlgJ